MLSRVHMCSVLSWFGFLLYCMNSTLKSSAICCLIFICRYGCLLWSWKKTLEMRGRSPPYFSILLDLLFIRTCVRITPVSFPYSHLLCHAIKNFIAICYEYNNMLKINLGVCQIKKNLTNFSGLTKEKWSYTWFKLTSMSWRKKRSLISFCRSPKIC